MAELEAAASAPLRGPCARGRCRMNLATAIFWLMSMREPQPECPYLKLAQMVSGLAVFGKMRNCRISLQDPYRMKFSPDGDGGQFRKCKLVTGAGSVGRIFDHLAQAAATACGLCSTAPVISVNAGACHCRWRNLGGYSRSRRRGAIRVRSRRGSGGGVWEEMSTLLRRLRIMTSLSRRRSERAQAPSSSQEVLASAHVQMSWPK